MRICAFTIALVAYLAVGATAHAAANTALGTLRLSAPGLGCLDELASTTHAYETATAAAALARINEGRRSRGVAPLQIDRKMWVEAMWIAAKLGSIPFERRRNSPMPTSTPCPAAQPNHWSYSQLPTGVVPAASVAVSVNDNNVAFLPEYTTAGLAIAQAEHGHMAVLILGSRTNPEPVVNLAPRTGNDFIPFTSELQNLAKIALANDSDPEQEMLTIASASAKFGDVYGYGRNLSYQLKEGFNGTDTITYTVSDLFGATATATIRLKVGNGPSRCLGDGNRCLTPAEVAANQYANTHVILSIGQRYNVVVRSRMNLMYVGIHAAKPGPVKLTVRRGARVISRLTSKTTGTNGYYFRVSKLIPRSKLKAGSYTLTGSYFGKLTTIKFRIV